MGNRQHTREGYLFGISSNRRIYHHRWTKLLIPNKVIYHVHTLACHSKSEIGLTFWQQDITDIIYKPNDEPDKVLYDGDSDYNLADENAYTYYSYNNFNYDRNLDLVIVGVNPNNPNNNHPPPHQRQEDE